MTKEQAFHAQKVADKALIEAGYCVLEGQATYTSLDARLRFTITTPDKEDSLNAARAFRHGFGHKVGDKLTIYGKTYTVSGFSGKSLLATLDATGKVYRIRPKHLLALRGITPEQERERLAELAYESKAS